MKTRVFKYFVTDCTFNGIFSRDYLIRIKNEAHVINLDDKQSKEKHWILLFIDQKKDVSFDSFRI